VRPFVWAAPYAFLLLSIGPVVTLAFGWFGVSGFCTFSVHIIVLLVNTKIDLVRPL
jgi:hypothetical protein